MSGVFGFDSVISEMDGYIRKAKNAKKAVRESADEMRDLARSNASAQGLFKTGAGVSGIDSEHHEGYSEIGWSNRPNLHLYFHERGFHALDNRYKEKWRLKRQGKRGKGARSYRGVTATYIPPKPHMRPAFTAKKNEFYKRVQDEIT